MELSQQELESPPTRRVGDAIPVTLAATTLVAEPFQDAEAAHDSVSADAAASVADAPRERSTQEPSEAAALSGSVEDDLLDDAAALDGQEGEAAMDANGKPAPKITVELLSQGGFYDMPMAKAARILGRTEGSFQRVCRGLGILRWPYRVRKSLQAIMEKTEEYLDDSAQEDGMSKAEVLKVLQAHMNDIKGISGSGMDKATKQYRQYIFKLNHKLARKAAKQGQAAPDTGSFKVKGMLKAASRIQKSRLSAHENRIESAASGAPVSATAYSSGGDAQPTRPTPRRFLDLPASLAFSPLGRGERGDIMGTMATSAAIQSRFNSGSSRECQAACLQDDQELLKLCMEMDAHLQAAQQALLLKEPFLPQHLQMIAGSNPYLQQILSTALGVGHPLLSPAPQRDQGQAPQWQLR